MTEACVKPFLDECFSVGGKEDMSVDIMLCFLITGCHFVVQPWESDIIGVDGRKWDSGNIAKLTDEVIVSMGCQDIVRFDVIAIEETVLESVVNDVWFIVKDVREFGVNDAKDQLVGSNGSKRVGVISNVVDDKVKNQWVFGESEDRVNGRMHEVDIHGMFIDEGDVGKVHVLFFF